VITQWNDAEDDLLQGLPLRAQIIYLRGLRRYMNYKTGVVGGPDRRISLKMLSEVAEAFNNRQREQPGKKEVIVSLDQLKKVGLIERVEDKDYLIFFLCKADRNQSVSDNHGTTTAQPRHNHGTNYGTDKPSNYAAQEDNSDIHKNSVDFPSTGTTAHIGVTDNGLTDKDIYLDKGDKSPSPKKQKKEKPEIVLPDWLNRAEWEKFELFRKKKRKGLDDLSRPLMLEKLTGLTVEQQKQVIDYSIGAGYPDLYPDSIKQKSLGDRTSQNQGFSKTNGGNSTASKVINGNFSDKDYGESVIRLPGFTG